MDRRTNRRQSDRGAGQAGKYCGEMSHA
jgi:hypothetical protein